MCFQVLAFDVASCLWIVPQWTQMQASHHMSTIRQNTQQLSVAFCGVVYLTARGDEFRALVRCSPGDRARCDPDRVLIFEASLPQQGA